MSLLDQIKARQLAEAADSGHDPYAVAVDDVLPVPVAAAVTTLPDPPAWSVLSTIKSQQLQDHANPYDDTADNAPAGTDAPQTLEHYQAAMSADLARLAPIKDIVERAKLKAAMIGTYWDFVQAYVKNGDNYPNDIAVRVCIWLFDILDIERGLDLAVLLIKQNQPTPPKFDRDLATFVSDELYDWANALLKQGQSASPYLDEWLATVDREGWSLAPPVHSKLLVMLAKHKMRVGEYLTVVALCEKAEAVNPDGAGVKKLKADAQAKAKAAGTPA